MLQFLYPLGLLAACGIIIPVIVHLWHMQKKKTLRIGSVSLLSGAVKQHKKSFSIRDWPLLLLRCLLILFIALILSVPFYRSAERPADQHGWILIEKQDLPALWKHYPQEIDSLSRLGFELRDFSPGFSGMTAKDTILAAKDRQLTAKGGTPLGTDSLASSVPVPAQILPISYFALIRQLNAELKPGDQVFLYTRNQLDRFKGEQPEVDIHLHWKFLPVEANPVVSLTAPRKDTLSTSAIQIQIFSDKKALDAAYVEAAILAMAEFTKKAITVKYIKSIQEVTKDAHLVFWLADREPDAADLQTLPKGISFFQYAGSRLQPIKSVLLYQPGAAIGQAALSQRYQFKGKSYQAVWQDGFGVPLLTLDAGKGIKHYRFYSRFNQHFTGLVWSDHLVRALIPLVIPQSGDESGFDDQSVASLSMQKVPSLIVREGMRKSQGFSTDDRKQISVNTGDDNEHSERRAGRLTNLFWWLAMFTFFIERLVVYRKMRS